MRESVKSVAVALGSFIGLMVVLWMVTAVLFGFGTPVSESTFVGQPVDVEYESGAIFETSSVELKTGEHSDETKEFCIYPSDSAVVEELRTATEQQRTVTVTYERPLYVGLWKCGEFQPILTEFEVSGV